MTNDAARDETANDATRIVRAGYCREGYVVARWESADDMAVTAFVLALQYVRQQEAGVKYFIVEDGLARFAAFPWLIEEDGETTRDKYMLTVTPYSGHIAQASSPPFKLPLRPPSDFEPLDFTERLVYTPLLFAPGQNVVKVRLLSENGKPIAGEPISWSVPSEYPTVRLESTRPTKTDRDGVATNLIYVGGGDEAPQSLTVSAWRGDRSSTGSPTQQHRIAAVFDCVEANAFCSFVRNYAHPLPTDNPYTRASPLRPPEDQLITATVTVLDDKSRPVRGLPFSWRMEPNPATLAYRLDPDGTSSWLDWTGSPWFESGFRVVTNDEGQSTILFANTEPQIMGVSPAVNLVELPYLAVFTGVDRGLGILQAPRLPTRSNTLDLDAYPDFVPVTIPLQVELIEQAAMWLNNDIVSIDYLGSASNSTDAILIPSWRFVSGNASNTLGYVAGYPGGNAKDSKLTKFRVTGRAHLPGPEPGGRYEAPSFEAAKGLEIVNDSAIAGGLQIRIPAYVDIAAGQWVTLNVYLTGYYQNSPYRKFDFVNCAHEVTRDDVEAGFVIVVDQNELTGFGLSPQGEAGTFVAQYAVSSGDPPLVLNSKQLTASIVTTVPFKASTWTAFIADGGSDEDLDH